MNLILKVALLTLALGVRVLSPKKIAERKSAANIGGDRFMEPELEWKEYKLHIDLYRFYLGIVLKALAFFYGITGLILSLIFNPARVEKGQEHVLRVLLPLQVVEIFLAVPIAMSVVLGFVFLVGGELWRRLVRDINRKVNKSRQVNVVVAPKIILLTWVLWVFGVLFFLVGFSVFLLAYTGRVL
jgi:hypothetical protein